MTTWSYIAGRSTNPGAVWRVRGERDEAARRSGFADYDGNGQRVGQGASWTNTPTAEELDDWDATALEIAARTHALALPLDALYIRWHTLPRSGRSRNHATGQQEHGVSVYEARYNPMTDEIEYADTAAVSGAAITYLITGADCYLVTGDHAGTGSDGEPLITAPRIIARLTPTATGFAITHQEAR